MDDSWQEKLKEARERTAQLSASLPNSVDAATSPVIQKVAWKYLIFRETLLWRTEEFSRTACKEIKEDRVISAFLLTRAIAENTAALNYIFHKIDTALSSGDAATLDEEAMRLLMGSKASDWPHQAVNVLKMLDKIDQLLPGFRKQYDVMSEYAHPNWAGTSLAFSEIDYEQRVTRLGKNNRRQDSLKGQCLILLNLSLSLFSVRYDEVSVAFPRFNEFCSKNFDNR